MTLPSLQRVASPVPDYHEAANIFPMDEEHLAALVEDIKVCGLRVPIELLDGKVIDGRRRSKACQMAGVPPTYRAVTVADPVAYVISLNFHRRQLTPSQLGMVAGRARSYYDAQAKARQKEGGAKGGGKVMENFPEASAGEQTARDAAGKAVGVSGRTVDFATRVLTQGTPELIQAVDEGRMAVSTAAVHAADPPDVQRAHVERAKRKYHSTADGTEFGATKEGRKKKTTQVDASPEPCSDEIRSRGVGVRLANEAVDCLKRIPKHDALRARGFQIVTDWIRRNR